MIRRLRERIQRFEATSAEDDAGGRVESVGLIGEIEADVQTLPGRPVSDVPLRRQLRRFLVTFRSDVLIAETDRFQIEGRMFRQTEARRGDETGTLAEMIVEEVL